MVSATLRERCCCWRKVNNAEASQAASFMNPRNRPGRRGENSGMPLNAMDRRRACAPPCGWRDLDSDQSGEKITRRYFVKRSLVEGKYVSGAFSGPYLRIQRWRLEAELVNVGKKRPVQLLSGCWHVQAALSLLLSHNFCIARGSFMEKKKTRG